MLAKDKPMTIWPLSVAARGHVNSEDLARLLPAIFNPNTPIADFGCGRGFYVKELQEKGFNAIGFEGTKRINRISYTPVRRADLSKPLKLTKKHNIISLEVAEHLLPEQQPQFVQNIVENLDNTLLLSWAIPGQGGDGHNNCRCNVYVMRLFQQYGLTLDYNTTLHLRATVQDASWFANTLFLFRR